MNGRAKKFSKALIIWKSIESGRKRNLKSKEIKEVFFSRKRTKEKLKSVSLVENGKIIFFLIFFVYIKSRKFESINEDCSLRFSDSIDDKLLFWRAILRISSCCKSWRCFISNCLWRKSLRTWSSSRSSAKIENREKPLIFSILTVQKILKTSNPNKIIRCHKRP